MKNLKLYFVPSTKGPPSELPLMRMFSIRFPGEVCLLESFCQSGGAARSFMSVLTESQDPLMILPIRVPRGDPEEDVGIRMLLDALEYLISGGNGTKYTHGSSADQGAPGLFSPEPLSDRSQSVVQSDYVQKSRSSSVACQSRIASRASRTFGIIGDSLGLKRILDRLPMVASCDSSVLILGETGTGKDLIARAIHHLSLRANMPFIPVQCGALPGELVENELFGHERGAYTGATAQSKGLVAEALGGTLFLDEVDTLPLPAQVKLLRLLENKEYRAVGDAGVRRADVRVVSACNSRLIEAIRAGSFRQDLYYRLKVISLEIPPLRDRRGDIPLLAEHFLKKFGAHSGKSIKGFSREANQRLLSYDWPGNVRELEHVVEQAVVFSEGEWIKAEDLTVGEIGNSTQAIPYKASKVRAIARFEQDYLKALIRATGGNVSEAAKAAELDRSDFRRLLRKSGIDIHCFRITQD